MENIKPVGVSVVITTVNRPLELSLAIKSVIMQKYSPLEIIVVVDGGSSESNKIVSNIDGDIKIINNIPGVGGAESRNVGIRAAKYEYIALLDDDDVWLQGKLKNQIVCMLAEKCNDVISFTSLYTYVRNPQKLYILPREQYLGGEPVGDFLFSLKNGRWNGWIQTSTLMATKDVFLKNPFDSKLPKHQDWDWIIRAQKLGIKIKHLSSPYTIYNKNLGHSVSKSPLWAFSYDWVRSNKNEMSDNSFRDFILSVVNNGISKDNSLSVVHRIQKIIEIDKKEKLVKTSALSFVRFHMQYIYNLLRSK